MRCTRRSTPPRRHTAWSPSVSTSTSATPACSTSARPGSPPLAPTASPSRSPSSTGRGTPRCRSLSLARSSSPCCSASRRCGCAPTTWRSSPSPPPRSSATSVNSTRFSWLTGGSDGKQGWTGFFQDLNPWVNDDRFHLGDQVFDGYRLFMMVLGWSLVAVISLLVWALMRSPWGRVLKSIREDEDAARALGKNVVAFKMQSLILGGAIGSIGGLMFAAQTQAATPGQYATTLTFFSFTIIILGGLGRVIGPIVGTIIFFFVIQFIDNVLNQATRQRPGSRLARHHRQLQPGQVDHRRCRSRPARHLPSAGHLGRSPRAGVRCPLSSLRT